MRYPLHNQPTANADHYGVSVRAHFANPVLAANQLPYFVHTRKQEGRHWAFLGNDEWPYEGVVFEFRYDFNTKDITVSATPGSVGGDLPTDALDDILKLREPIMALIQIKARDKEHEMAAAASAREELLTRRSAAADQILASRTREQIEESIESKGEYFTLRQTSDGRWQASIFVDEGSNEIEVEDDEKLRSLAILLACIEDESLLDDDDDEDDELLDVFGDDDDEEEESCCACDCGGCCCD